MPRQKNYKTRNLQKCYGVYFVLVTNCWVWGLAVRVVCVPCERLEKTTFSFASSYWLEIAPGVPLSSQGWDPVWLRPVHALWVLPQSLCKSVCVSFFSSLCHFSGYELATHHGLDLYFLRINRSEHYFICIWAIWICSLEKCSAHCLFKHDFFYVSEFGALPGFWISIHYQIGYLQILVFCVLPLPSAKACNFDEIGIFVVFSFFWFWNHVQENTSNPVLWIPTSLYS